MERKLFSPMKLGRSGGSMNISLRSRLQRFPICWTTVSCTTPQVTVVDVANFSIGNVSRAMGVEIEYVEGLEALILCCCGAATLK